MLLLIGLRAQAQHPVGYGSVRSTSQVGSFTFAELDRGILREKTAMFYSPEPVTMTFDVLVTPSGDVKYVRSPRLRPEQQDLRLACTSALYGFAFAPVSESIGEKWLKATLLCEDH